LPPEAGSLHGVAVDAAGDRINVPRIGERQAAVGRQIPAAGKTASAELRRLLRRLADRLPERRIFVAPGELDEAAATKAVAIAARRIAVAVDAGIDIVGEALRIEAIRLGRLRARKQRRENLTGAVGGIAEVLDILIQRRASSTRNRPTPPPAAGRWK
jgi:hypothetical protein